MHHNHRHETYVPCEDALFSIYFFLGTGEGMASNYCRIASLIGDISLLSTYLQQCISSLKTPSVGMVAWEEEKLCSGGCPMHGVGLFSPLLTMGEDECTHHVFHSRQILLKNIL